MPAKIIRPPIQRIGASKIHLITLKISLKASLKGQVMIFQSILKNFIQISPI